MNINVVTIFESPSCTFFCVWILKYYVWKYNMQIIFQEVQYVKEIKCALYLEKYGTIYWLILKYEDVALAGLGCKNNDTISLKLFK
jgi:hypothetical protein